MEGKHKPEDLFLPSGCITEAGFYMYLLEMTDEEQHTLLNAHLGECEFCEDALEGLQMLAEKKSPEAALRYIKDVKISLDEKFGIDIPDKKSFRLSPGKLTWFAIAATVIVFIGLYQVIHLEMSQQKKELAVNSVPTPKTQPETDSLSAVRPVPGQEIIPESKKLPVPGKIRFTAPTAGYSLNLQDSSVASAKKDLSADNIIGGVMPKTTAAAAEVTADQAGMMKKSEQVISMEYKPAAKRKASGPAAEPALQKQEKIANADESPVFTAVEEMPTYPGGEEALKNYFRENMRYPDKAREGHVSGTVYVNLVVNNQGKVSKVKLSRGLGYGCDEEAIRLIKKMPDWNPAKQAGKTVDYRMTLPVKFQLAE